MHSTQLLSINLLAVVVSILAILILVGVFSSKRALMAMVLLAGLGLIVFVIGGLFLSIAGLRRGPTRAQPYVYLEPSSPSMTQTLAETDLVLLGDDTTNRLTIELVPSESCDDDNSPCAKANHVADHRSELIDTKSEAVKVEPDHADADDDEDVWSEDTTLDELADTGEQQVQPKEDDRPSWIFEDLQVTSEPHRITVSAGPHATWKEVDRNTDAALQEGLARYVQWYLTAGGQDFPADIRADELSVALPRLRECVVNKFDYVHESSYPSMNEMPMRYLLLEFDRDFRKRVLEPSWNRSRSVARSKQASVFSGGVLALLAGAFGLLKLDSATGGKRRRALTTAGLVAGAAGMLALIGIIR